MDEGGKAVLCDFGLSRVRADVTSRTMKADAAIIIGSRNWMAPERLIGGSIKKPSDIYAYGMTIYEVSYDSLLIISVRPKLLYAVRSMPMRFPLVISAMVISLIWLSAMM